MPQAMYSTHTISSQVGIDGAAGFSNLKGGESVPSPGLELAVVNCERRQISISKAVGAWGGGICTL